MAGPLPLQFVRSASAEDQLDDSLVEIALIGRSNVGKSSLLNALAGRKQLARTSKTPGATRLLNVFELDPVGSRRWIVDLPGYGYANASRSERDRWGQMIEGYLTDRPSLACGVVLIDGEIGPTPLDLQTVEWLDHIGLARRFVATKSDKVRSTKRPARKTELATKLGVPKGEVHWVSASTGTGLDEVRGLVLDLLTPPG